MPKITMKNVTKKKLLFAMMRGWTKLGFATGTFLANRNKVSLDYDENTGRWVSDNSLRRPYKPACGCALGAVMFDQGMTSHDGVENLFRFAGMDADQVISINDDCDSKSEAIKRLKPLFA